MDREKKVAFMDEKCVVLLFYGRDGCFHGREVCSFAVLFGWHAVSEKLRAIQYYRVLNIINLKLYNVL